MSLTVRLDSETVHCLQDLRAETGQDSRSLSHRLIRERWQQRTPLPSITQQLGGHPDHVLATLPPGSADRLERGRPLRVQLRARRKERR